MKKLIVLMMVLFASIAYSQGRETLTVTAASAVGFTDITCRNTCKCVVKNGGYEVFVDWLGSTPTSTRGVPLAAKETIHLSESEYNALQAIATSTTSTLYGMCQ